MDDWLNEEMSEINGKEDAAREDAFIKEGMPASEGEESAPEGYSGFSIPGPKASEPTEAVKDIFESFKPVNEPEEANGNARSVNEPTEAVKDIFESFKPVNEPEEAYGSVRSVSEPSGSAAAGSENFAAAGEKNEQPADTFDSIISANASAENGPESSGCEAPKAEEPKPVPPRRPYVSPYDAYRFNGGTRPVPGAEQTVRTQPVPGQYTAQPAAGAAGEAEKPYAQPAEGQTYPSWRSQPVGSPYGSNAYRQPARETPAPRKETFDGGYGGGFGPGGPSDPSKPSGEPKKKGGKGKKIAAILGIAALFGLVAALVFLGVSRILGGIFGISNTAESTAKTIEPPKVIIGSNDRNDESSRQPAGRSDIEESEGSLVTIPDKKTEVSDGKDLSIPDVVDLVMPSMVAITNTSLNEYRSLFGERGQYESVSTGSGIIVGETDTDYLIATNAHVTEKAEKITVTFIDDSVVEGTVSASDSSNDLAIVSVKKESIEKETLSQICIISIGNSDDLRVGETVIAIGNALGYGQSVSRGVVSALNRPVEVDGYSARELIQTDASINPGNSGGALINLRGELVGINEVKAVDTRVEGVGYAIPTATAKPILENLGTKAARTKVDEANASYIGIHCMTMSSYYVQMGYPAGAYVSDVMKGGPAEAAGLLAGDIITAIDGSSVTTSTQLISYLEYYAAGEKVKFTVKRLNASENGFDVHEIEITLGNKNDAVFNQQGEAS